MSGTIDDKTLKKLLIILDKPRTARAIARLTKCSKPTAYKRLQTLRARGFTLRLSRVREGHSGPRARAYHVDL